MNAINKAKVQCTKGRGGKLNLKLFTPNNKKEIGEIPELDNLRLSPGAAAAGLTLALR